MLLRSRKNRRKVDLKAEVRARAPIAFKLVAAATVMIALGFAGQRAWVWGCHSERFGLEHVNVRGANRASDSELLKLTGLSLGQNILQLDVGAIEHAFASHPWVKSAKVSRRLPDTLDVVLVEHEPQGVVSLGELYLVNAEGQPFKRLTPQDDLDLPLITGLDRDAFVENPELSKLRILSALALIPVWNKADGVLSEIRTSDLGLTAVTAEGREVRLGEGDIDVKLKRLRQIQGELTARKLSADVIRLDNRMRPDWVTVQLSASSSPTPSQTKTRK
jgi:cell division protein FtsQ